MGKVSLIKKDDRKYITFYDEFKRHHVSGLFPDGRVRTLVTKPGYKIVMGNATKPYYVSKIAMTVTITNPMSAGEELV